MNCYVERDKKYLEKLKKYLNKNYNFIVKEIKPASRGMEGETWVVTTSSDIFFVKINFLSRVNKNFIKSVDAIDILNEKGINNINEIIKTKKNENYIKFNKKVLVVFKYIDGKIDYNYPYLKLMKLLINIYKTNIKTEIPTENFKIDKLLNRLNINLLKAQKYLKLNNLLNKYQVNIQKYVRELKKYYEKIDKTTLKVITHGDVCVNVMVGTKVFLIDWDEILLAPIERDCWFFMDYKYKIKNINNLLKKNNIDYTISIDMLEDLVLALEGLGYTKKEIDKTLEKVDLSAYSSLEEAIKGILKNMKIGG